jgi:hypothetical protein
MYGIQSRLSTVVYVALLLALPAPPAMAIQFGGLVKKAKDKVEQEADRMVKRDEDDGEESDNKDDKVATVTCAATDEACISRAEREGKEVVLAHEEPTPPPTGVDSPAEEPGSAAINEDTSDVPPEGYQVTNGHSTVLLSDDVLTRYEKALAVQDQGWKEVLAYPQREEQYTRCTQEHYAARSTEIDSPDPAVRKRAEARDRAELSSDDAVRARADAEQEAELRKKCGVHPLRTMGGVQGGTQDVHSLQYERLKVAVVKVGAFKDWDEYIRLWTKVAQFRGQVPGCPEVGHSAISRWSTDYSVGKPTPRESALLGPRCGKIIPLMETITRNSGGLLY